MNLQFVKTLCDWTDKSAWHPNLYKRSASTTVWSKLEIH